MSHSVEGSADWIVSVICPLTHEVYEFRGASLEDVETDIVETFGAP